MKKRAFVVVLLLVGALGFSLSAPSQIRLNPEVEAYIRGLVSSHPSAEVRNNLGEWLKTGKVTIATDPKIASLASNLLHRLNQPDLKVPVIVANPDYAFTTTAARDEDILPLKYIQIFHEYVHVKNHFSGKFLLGGKYEDKGTVTQQAKFFWDSEWDACVQHWEFAKTLHAERLLYPDIPKAGFANESLRLLEGFYRGQLLKAYPPKQISQYKPYWEKYYEQRKKEFSTRR